jgi:hypothetical protein
MQDIFVHRDGHMPITSLKRLRTQITGLSGFKPRLYDCCKNSCVCFYGYLGNLNECPHCQTPRYNAAGAPQNSFEFMSLIQQLLALFQSPSMSKKLRYRADYETDNEEIGDVFDTDGYKELCQKNVTVDGKELPRKHFQGERDIALGFSADGMCPFKRRKHSCWPLILINYNLDPKIRTLLGNIICVGVIPGPHSPKDLGSYLQPLIEELIELARGVDAFDAATGEVFKLFAHLLNIFGDIPAVTKFLDFIGHNGRLPCRFCKIVAIQGNSTHLYCPLHRQGAPSIDPLNLPLRTHDECVRLGMEVLQAPSDNARSNLATETGIKGVSLLAQLSSVSIPASFPIDIMHMIFLNLIPQMALLWTGKFHELDDGK